MRVLSNTTGWVVTGLLGRSLLGLAVCGMSGLLLVQGGCGSGGSGGAPSVATVQTGTVSGQVTTLVNGVVTPVTGATVTTSAGSTTSGGDGTFTVPAPVGERSVIHVEAGGYAEAFPVAYVTSGQTTGLGVRLLATGVTSVVSVSTGGTVTVPNSTAQITLPADGLVPKNGGAAAGTVNVAVTPINPANDPRLMPGDFTGVSAGGITPIESFGALLIDIRDNSGTRYNLATGQTATIRIPLGTLSTNPPATIPLFYFDDNTGLWQQEGSATLQGTGLNQFYTGTVRRISYWNADRAFETVFVSGCLRDSNNQAVANQLVSTNGTDYSGRAVGITAADGTFRVAVRRDSRATLSVVEFSLQTFTFTTVTNVVTIGPSTIDFTLSNCLVKAPGPLTVTTSVLPGGTVGQSYNQTLTATGGIPGYVWSLNPGSNPLPLNLSLNPTGVISGVPMTAGTTVITVTVTDSASIAVTKELSLTISLAGTPVAITSPSLLPVGTVGTAYDTRLAASGGIGALSWSAVSALPVWLTLDPSTGQLTGTPTTAETSTFTIRVQDSGTPQQSDEQVFSLAITDGGIGGVGGSLTVTGANVPASIGGTFVPNRAPSIFSTGAVIWHEGNTPSYSEDVVLFFDPSGLVTTVSFQVRNAGVLTNHWICNANCQGVVTLNRTAGTAILSAAVAPSAPGFTPPPITLNGTLNFTPF
jgi:hypothetical protein